MDTLERHIAHALGARTVRRTERIQSLWGGYGEAVRLQADGRSVVAKHVVPGAGHGRGHARKLQSYAVELAFYRDHAARCPVRLAAPLHLEGGDGRWLFVFEDLAASGFTPRPRAMAPMLRWLAGFHAAYLGIAPTGLWPRGTYWHLATRPDEHRAMADGPLKRGAATIDAHLAGARFRTLVHGDAKPANFLEGPTTVAAVDFQYVGAGPGIVDVAYLLTGERAATRDRGLDTYFAALRQAVAPEVDADALEAEWRALAPWAWADFHRFLAGWSPGWTPNRDERALTAPVLATL